MTRITDTNKLTSNDDKRESPSQNQLLSANSSMEIIPALAIDSLRNLISEFDSLPPGHNKQKQPQQLQSNNNLFSYGGNNRSSAQFSPLPLNT